MTDQANARPAEPGPSDPLCIGVRHGTTQVIWMNDPGRRNALSLEIRSVLIAEMEAAMADPEVRAIVLAGSGGCSYSEKHGKIYSQSLGLARLYEDPLKWKIIPRYNVRSLRRFGREGEGLFFFLFSGSDFFSGST